MSIEILLVDDQRIVLEGLRCLLGQEPDLRVVGGAVSGAQALELAERLQPDLVIMETALPDLAGSEVTSRLQSLCPTAKVIALSIHSDPRYVLEMLKAGAAGYLLKQCAYEDLSRAIREVLANRAYLSPEVTQTLLKDYVQYVAKEDAGACTALSPREREVMRMLAEGNSTKQVAERLGLSVKTVEAHRQNLMRKLGLTSTAQLVKYAIREGLTSL